MRFRPGSSNATQALDVVELMLPNVVITNHGGRFKCRASNQGLATMRFQKRNPYAHNGKGGRPKGARNRLAYAV